MSTPNSSEPLVTVLIPARNEEAFIGACLSSVLAQTYANLDVVVVDGASEDGTCRVVNEIAARDPRVRVASNPKRVIPSALNIGLREARGRWLVRVDAHSSVPTDYIERVMAHLADSDWGGVGGRKDGVGVTPAGRAIAAAMGSRFGVGNSTYHHGTTEQVVEHLPFGGYPTDLLRELGGWDERILANEDFELDWRIRQSGRQLLFDPAIRIDWMCRQSTKELLRQYVRYGRGKARVAALHPRSMSIRHIALPLMVVWLVGAAVLLPFHPLWSAIAVAPYVALVVAGIASASRNLHMNERIHLPLIFPAMQLGWGFGFWRGVVDVVRDRSFKRGGQPQTQ